MTNEYFVGTQQQESTGHVSDQSRQKVPLYWFYLDYLTLGEEKPYRPQSRAGITSTGFNH